MKENTIIITKEGWKALNILDKQRFAKKYNKEYKPLSDEYYEKAWNKQWERNLGASYDEYPLADNERRISPNCSDHTIAFIKEFLDKQGFPYREDGFVAEYDNLKF